MSCSRTQQHASCGDKTSGWQISTEKTYLHTLRKNTETKPSDMLGTDTIEPVCEKTNNLGPDQVQHKPGCTVTKDG